MENGCIKLVREPRTKARGNKSYKSFSGYYDIIQ